MRIILSNKRGSKSQLFTSSKGNGLRSFNFSATNSSVSEPGTSVGFFSKSKESLFKSSCLSSDSKQEKRQNVTDTEHHSISSLKNERPTCDCFLHSENSSSPSKNSVKRGLYFFGNDVCLITKLTDSQRNNLIHSKTCPIKNMSTNSIYHEKQVKSLCALHALNNLLQDPRAFSQNDLDTICSGLSPNSWIWVNPHKSVLGLGNYDINVIMTALQGRNFETVWFDKRKDPADLNFSNIFGYILNVPSDCKIGWLSFPLKRKHWVAIRKLPHPKDSSVSSYYNLDSKLEFPDLIGNDDNLIYYLRKELLSPEKELFLVVTSEVGRDEAWKKCKSESTQVNCSGTNNDDSNGIFCASEITDIRDIRKTSNDSGVVELLSDFKEFKDISVVDLDKEEYFRRQSSGVWSDFN